MYIWVCVYICICMLYTLWCAFTVLCIHYDPLRNMSKSKKPKQSFQQFLVLKMQALWVSNIPAHQL